MNSVVKHVADEYFAKRQNVSLSYGWKDEFFCSLLNVSSLFWTAVGHREYQASASLLWLLVTLLHHILC